MGVRESIIGRMQRNGGTARLRAVPDGGTEVELEMERAETDVMSDRDRGERGSRRSRPARTSGGGADGRRVRVVLVDDHRMFRTGVQAEIGRTDETGVEVVGEAADVDQAVTVITATRPEVVLLDVHLPGGGGVEVLRRCAAVDGRRRAARCASSRCPSRTPRRTSSA